MLTGWCSRHQRLSLEYSHRPPKQPWAQELLLCAPHTPQLPVRSPGLLNVVFCTPRLCLLRHLHKWWHNMWPFDLASCPHHNVFKVRPCCCRSQHSVLLGAESHSTDAWALLCSPALRQWTSGLQSASACCGYASVDAHVQVCVWTCASSSSGLEGGSGGAGPCSSSTFQSGTVFCCGHATSLAF